MKRLGDLVISIAILILLSPLFLIVAVLVRVKLGSPILFHQLRPGRDGKVFTLVKFRTMTDHLDHTGELLPDRDRLTHLGRFLRSTSLDELPEFWNVITGDMSIVGPRPLLVEYLPLYSDHAGRRHEVRPGITGLAQVKGRNSLSWEEKFDLDVWYVDNRTFRIDCAILFWTLRAVLKREGISSECSPTMPPFNGSD